MQATLPASAVVRVSSGSFDPARFAEVERMSQETAKYLIPAISKLPGLISYFAAVSPSGSIVHVSVWDTDTHAQGMASLKEMIVDARQAAEAAGVRFTPIINHPVSWAI
jgi:hypothetical protein